MRIQDLKPGMKCYRYGQTPVTVVEVEMRNPDEGILRSTVLIEVERDGSRQRLQARNLVSQEEIDQRKQRKNQKEMERVRLQSALAEYLPSARAKQEYGDVLSIALDESDCMKLIKLYEGKMPSVKQLPSSYPGGIPSATLERHKKAKALSARVRRAVGMGWTSKWLFPREWERGEWKTRMYVAWSPEEIESILDKLSGRDSQGSALEQLFC